MRSNQHGIWCRCCGQDTWETMLNGDMRCRSCGDQRGRATPYRLTGEHIVRERFGDERINGPHFDFGGPAGSYEQMTSDDE